VERKRFPEHGGGHAYRTNNCVFGPGPLLYAARPLNNDRRGARKDQQGELFIYDLAKQTSRRHVIPQPKGFQPKYEFEHYFGSPVLSVNSRGDLLCRWTLAGNGDHAFALLKKGADTFVVKRVKDIPLESGSLVVPCSDGTWYLVHWASRQHCAVCHLDEQLNLRELGKLTSKDCGDTYDACFLDKYVLHLVCNLRCVDFHVNTRKWLHHREVHRSELPDWTWDVTALQLGNDSLHHLWRLDGRQEKPRLTGVYYQPEANLEPLKVCPSLHYRAVAIGNRIVLCYTMENAPTRVFFRIIHHGTLGPISEITIENKLKSSLWKDSFQLYAEGDRIWFVNTMEPDAVCELKIVDRKR
jgi:hypothetical protein